MRTRRPLTRWDILRAKAPDVMDFVNARLYELCRKYPRHKEAAHGIAKVLLIGRAYSAAIERKAGPAEVLYPKIGSKMSKSRLDQLLRGLPDGRSPLSVRLARAVEVHDQLMKIWGKAGADGKRSLASKYLHFHRRDIFPMFDSRASRGIREVTPDARRVADLPLKPGGDPTYRVFCRRYMWLLGYLRFRFGERLTLRQADRLLLNISAEKTTRKS